MSYLVSTGHGLEIKSKYFTNQVYNSVYYFIWTMKDKIIIGKCPGVLILDIHGKYLTELPGKSISVDYNNGQICTFDLPVIYLLNLTTMEVKEHNTENVSSVGFNWDGSLSFNRKPSQVILSEFVIRNKKTCNLIIGGQSFDYRNYITNFCFLCDCYHYLFSMTSGNILFVSKAPPFNVPFWSDSFECVIPGQILSIKKYNEYILYDKSGIFDKVTLYESGKLIGIVSNNIETVKRAADGLFDIVSHKLFTMVPMLRVISEY